MRTLLITILFGLAGCAPSAADTKVRPDRPASSEPAAPATSQGSQSAGEAYPNPNLLVEPGNLAKPEVARQFIVLDARERKAYDAGRLPGAQWVDAIAWAKTFGSGTDAQGWSKRIGNLGIDRDSRVVVYDANLSKDAARIWWILRYWGIADARLLNGGWGAWKATNLPIEVEKPNTATARTFEAVPNAKRLATKAQLLDALKSNDLQIVDARSQAEFCGIDKQNNLRAGAIPGAKQLEWSDLIEKQTQQFKSAGELRELFREAGIELDKPAATHCQSGGRASVMAFGMELMGATDVSNYYASWAEWGNARDTPIVVKKPNAK